MSITIEPKDATLGATITGIDLAQLDHANWKTVRQAFLEFGVLIFPGQKLSDDAQIAFASRFGELETELTAISNERADGEIVDDNDLPYWILRGNERWHIDSSFKPLAAKASCLTAMAVPNAGGETQWADMRAGYDVLTNEMKQRVEGLCALHSNYYSHEMLGQVPRTGDGYGFHTKGAPLRPLVKTHPETDRKSLYIGRHAYGIPGITEAQSEELLAELLELAAQSPRVTEHHWQPGDLAIWDNRRVLHRVAPYDYSQPRVMRHTRVAGDPASELAGTLPDTRATTYQPGQIALD
ncbi:MAG: TauD/TfdA family dioxygenase [Pseudomonadales bacterium]|nr:TauD/TfdA family dioxygenase [Pseudomonadales bacterium]